MMATGRWRATLLLGLLTASFLLKGGVHPRHMGWILLALSFLALPQMGRIAPRMPSKKAAKALLFCLGFGIVLQIGPLPSGLRTVVSPGTQSVLGEISATNDAASESLWRQILLHDLQVEAGESPQSLVFHEQQASPGPSVAGPASLDPGKTRWVLGVWLGAVVVFLLGTALARVGQATYFLYGLFGLCVAEAIWGLANRNGGSLGFFPKEHYLGAASGSLVNANHFASLMLIGLAAGVSLWHSSSRERTRWLTIFLSVGTGACLLAILASQSRAGVALAALGLIWLPRPQRTPRRKSILFALSLLVLAFLTTLVVGPGPVTGEAADPSLVGRLEIWTHGLGQWTGFPLVGSGLGTFSWIARMDQQSPVLFQFSHMHNDWLQLLVEGGALLALPIVAILVGAGRRVWTGLRAQGSPPAETALACGLALLALHALVDFPLQVPAILWTAAACFGICWGAIEPQPPHSPMRPPVLSWAFLAALAVIGLQAAKTDAIAQDNVRLLTDEPSSVQRIESQLLRERAGSREGLGRLALLRGQLLKSQKGAGLLAAENTAAAARRRIREQPLDTNAHLAEAGAWALACEILENAVESDRLFPEEALLKAEVALGRAVRLEPTNPLVFLQVAAIQNQLSGCSPFRRGHQRRAALALSRAVELDPWVSARAFRMTPSLPEVDFSLIHPTSAQAHYEKGLEWRKRGQLLQAKGQFELALKASPSFAPPHFSLGDVLRSQGEGGFEDHFQRYLGLEDAPTGMGAWSTLWLGDSQGAIGRFEDLLADEPHRIWLQNGLLAAQKQAETKP